MSTQFFYTLTLTFFGVGALGAVLCASKDRFAHYWAHGFAMLASVATLLTAVSVLRQGIPQQFNLIPLKGITIPFIISIDAFSAVFLLLIAILTFCASWYGLAYMEHYQGKYSLARFGAWYAIFTASLVGVVTTQSIFTFLWWWEMMSLSSYFLVTYDYRNEGNMKAGMLYLVMTQVGTACIAAALILMALATGALDFASIGSVSNTLTGWFPHIVFVLFLLGFGMKAGIIPLHIWLPEAHPAAPSHVSALMSGVMIKLAIYMLIRVLFEIMPYFSMEWGMVIVIVGAVSALLGVLYALTEHDMKRLLAYHSVENIGIILLGVGSAIMLKASGFDTLALLALVAGVFHTINHALFKSLLFLGAGSVLFRTHTRDIEKYGGLIKLMPWTATLFLVGAIAISGLPPFNGFASEWLTFQTMFAGVTSGLGMKVQTIWIGATVALALTSGLAAACFVKAFGVTFLALPRSKEASAATEVPFTMIGPMLILGVLCLMCGVFASSSVIPYLSVVLQNFVGGTAVTAWPTLSSVPTPWVFHLGNQWAIIMLLALGLMVTGVVRLWSGKRAIVRSIPWDCGVDLNARMEITAASFSRSLVTMFQGILRPTKQTEITYHDNETRYFVSSHAVHLHLGDLYSTYLYNPISHCVLWCSGRIKRLQSGVINGYILYIVVTLFILLIIALR